MLAPEYVIHPLLSTEIPLVFYISGVPTADSRTLAIHYEELRAGSSWWLTDCSEALTVGLATPIFSSSLGPAVHHPGLQTGQ